MRRAGATVRLVVGLAAAFTACDPGGAPLLLPEPDPQVFAREVYPLLLERCGFPACHGRAERPLALFGPGRTRLGTAMLPFDPATPEEVALSYARTRAMLVSVDGVRRSPLLRKPLAVRAGGAGHGGDDPWGAAPFPSKQDPGFQVVFFWATDGLDGEDAP